MRVKKESSDFKYIAQVAQEDCITNIDVVEIINVPYYESYEIYCTCIDKKPHDNKLLSDIIMLPWDYVHKRILEIMEEEQVSLVDEYENKR